MKLSSTSRVAALFALVASQLASPLLLSPVASAATIGEIARIKSVSSGRMPGDPVCMLEFGTVGRSADRDVWPSRAGRVEVVPPRQGTGGRREFTDEEKARYRKRLDAAEEARHAELVKEAQRLAARKMQLSDYKEFGIVEYNVLNLNRHVGKVKKGPNGEPLKDKDGNLIMEGGAFKDERAKQPWAIRGTATHILLSQPEIVMLMEVEGIEEAEEYAREELGDAYVIKIVEGNDGRNIQVAMGIRKDLLSVLDVEFTSHKDETWKDPTQGNREVTLHSRDVMQARFTPKGAPKGSPAFAQILYTHNKSMREREGDPMSRKMRGAQFAREAEIIREIQAADPGVPTFIAGDMNAKLHNPSAPEAKPLLDVINDVLDLAKLPRDNAELRGTHSYFGGGGASYSQLDLLACNDTAARAFVKAYVQQYTAFSSGGDPDGELVLKTLNLPNSQAQRNGNPSDHRPTVGRFANQGESGLLQTYLIRLTAWLAANARQGGVELLGADLRRGYDAWVEALAPDFQELVRAALAGNASRFSADPAVVAVTQPSFRAQKPAVDGYLHDEESGNRAPSVGNGGDDTSDFTVGGQDESTRRPKGGRPGKGRRQDGRDNRRQDGRRDDRRDNQRWNRRR